MSAESPNLLARIMRSASKIEPSELRAVLLSFGFVFTLMAAYYILRPVRDAMSSNWTDAELSTLFTATFIFSVAAVFLYGVAASRVKFRWLVPGVYGFFAVSFVTFYLAVQMSSNGILVDKAFFVWVSVFSLFQISVFWSLMADIFSKEQAPRLFAFIAVGSSVGALVGPLIPLIFAGIGAANLMLIAAALLLVPLPVIGVLERIKVSDLHNEEAHVDLTEQQAIGGNPFAGFLLFLKSPYLLGIGVFIFLYTAISTFVYFEIKNLLAGVDPILRTQIWAGMDLAVNFLAIGTAMFATGRIATRFGLAVTLALVPVAIVAGLLVVAMAPMIWVVVGLQVVRRAGNYAITRPGREMLFTVVDRETRFKAKPFIDIVVYRGGDMVTAWAFTGLTQGLGLGLGAVAAIGAGIAAIWAAVAGYLGRAYRQNHSKPGTKAAEYA